MVIKVNKHINNHQICTLTNGKFYSMFIIPHKSCLEGKRIVERHVKQKEVNVSLIKSSTQRKRKEWQRQYLKR